MLHDDTEAEDMVQQAWLRLQGTEREIANLPGWLTTVTTRLCLDRLRAKVPVPDEGGSVDVAEHVSDPADEVALADTVGVALRVVLDRLPPGERVAFVLHDSFGFEFATIAAILDTTPAAARKLASVAMGTPERIVGREEVARFFDGAAKAALSVFVEQRPGAAWVHRVEARVAFDFTVLDGMVTRIAFRAEPAVLAGVRSRRKDDEPVDKGAHG